jgi:aspartate/methionine/tyrosine aminotransferase
MRRSVREIPPFAMMHWAKSRVETARHNLGLSGVSAPDPDEIPLPVVDPAVALSTAANEGGIRPLREALAARHGVDADSVVASGGTSLANFNALFALAGPGDRVLVEAPTYGSLAGIPALLGARLERLLRRPEDGWVPRLDEIAGHAAAGPLAAVVLTRLHNPTGTDLPAAFLRELADLAERHDFRVLLDEVYLDFVEGARPGHAFSSRFVSTGSLTKAWGYGALRVGWVIGAPEVATTVREASYYLAVNGATWAQAVGAEVVRAAGRVLGRSRRIAGAGRAVFEEWILTRDDLAWVPPAGGLNAFVRTLRIADTAAFARRAFEEHGLAVAEGEFFDRPGWLRLCFGGDPAALRDSLRVLGDALDRA